MLVSLIRLLFLGIPLTDYNACSSPTSGGQYHWVALLAPRKYAIVFSWFAGWFISRIVFCSVVTLYRLDYSIYANCSHC